MRRPLVVVSACALALAGCRTGSVRVDFRPNGDSRYAYAIDVEADTTTNIDGRAPTESRSEQHLTAQHTVQSADGRTTVVDVRVSGPGLPDRSFEVTLDRAGSLVEVQRVEDTPSSALGDLGLSEVFPAAAGAPPDRALRPGTRWLIDEPVTLPGSATVHLTGSGRLAELGVVAGRKVATIISSYRLPVHQTSQSADGTVTLDGEQTTSTTATHALRDGAVQSVAAHTVGRFSLTLSPPDAPGPLLHGQLEVDVRSKTRRTR